MRRENITTIKELPGELACALRGLDAGQIDTEYRPGGWTVRQVVHHVADSHLNAYCRFKLALTEEGPTIKPYDEAAWAELPDNTTSAEVSLQLTEGLHKRFANLLDGMSESDFGRTLVHPESRALDAGRDACALRMALQTPYGSHYHAPGEGRLVAGIFKDFLRNRTISSDNQ